MRIIASDAQSCTGLCVSHWDLHAQLPLHGLLPTHLCFADMVCRLLVGIRPYAYEHALAAQRRWSIIDLDYVAVNYCGMYEGQFDVEYF